MIAQVDWSNQFDGSRGSGKQRALSNLTGVFSFTDPANVELMTKTLDYGDRVLLFVGALTNLEYTLRARDTVTGIEKRYENPAGRFCGVIDNQAF